ncbi:MAG: hypothetical protein HZR80_18740 [Candidatus Heimdallarchaeota archaeon]
MDDNKQVTELIKSLNDENSSIRKNAIENLLILKNEAWDTVEILLDHISIEESRAHCYHILDKISKMEKKADKYSSKILEIMINEKRSIVKIYAFNALKKIGSEKLLDEYKFLLSTDDNIILNYTIELIGTLGNKASHLKQLIFNIIKDNPNERLKSIAIQTLSKIAGIQYKEEIFKILKNNKSKKLRNSAANALSNINEIEKKDIEEIIKIFKLENNGDIRQTIVATLYKKAENNERFILPFFLNIIKNDERKGVRELAIQHSYNLDKENFPNKIIQNLLNEKNSITKRNIYTALNPLVKELELKNKEELILIFNSSRKVSSNKIENDYQNNKLIFIIMAFKPDLDPIFDAMKEVVEELGYKAKRVDKIPGDYKITDKIIEMITNSVLIIADLTHERPNVYFELGYARGIGKIVITTVRNGTKVHFDVKDWRYISYSDSRILMKKLREEINAILKKSDID